MRLRRTLILALVATAILAALLVLAGSAGGWVPRGYLLFLATVFLASLIGGLRAAFPAARSFEESMRRPHIERQPDPFEVFRLRLVAANGSRWSVHVRLRPLVQHIASARLAYRHGIDLEREPERAAALLQGTRTWELIRPDRPSPEDVAGPGLREPELRQLLEELEKL